MKLVPCILAIALAALALVACAGPSGAPGQSPARDALDPSTLIDTITHGNEVKLEDHLPEDESIPTVVYFTADW